MLILMLTKIYLKKKDKEKLKKEKIYKNFRLKPLKNTYEIEIFCIIAAIAYTFILSILVNSSIMQGNVNHIIVTEFLYSIKMYVIAFLTILATIFHYLKNEKIERYNESKKYNPIYILESKLTNEDLNNNEILIRVIFKESSASIRNVKVYTFTSNCKLSLVKSFALLKDNNLIYLDLSSKNIFIVADTLNNERVYSLIFSNRILHARDLSNSLKVSLNRLKLELQEPNDEIYTGLMSDLIKEIIYKNDFDI